MQDPGAQDASFDPVKEVSSLWDHSLASLLMEEFLKNFLTGVGVIVVLALIVLVAVFVFSLLIWAIGSLWSMILAL